MNATTAPAPAARIDRLLRASSVVWLCTVGIDGAPHLVPIWYSWDGERLFIASKPEAVKVRDLAADPRVRLAVGEPEDDFDVGLLDGVAELPAAPAREVLPTGHLRRYQAQLAAIGLTEAEYWATYRQAIVITPSRYLGWHGRTAPTSATDPMPGLVRRLLDRAREAARGLAPRPVPVAGAGA